MTSTRAILRLVKLKVAGPKRQELGPPKGFVFSLTQGPAQLDLYYADLDYLLVQPLGYSDVFEYRSQIKLAPRPWSRYCEWHDGPLDEPDDPRRRLYCPVTVRGDREYCSKHSRSERALYMFCLQYHSERALEACREVDKMIKGEYAVYMLDYGGDRPKVGTTRSFRLIERIAEQPHIVATTVAVVDSVYRARRLEMDISKSGVAAESRRYRWPGSQDYYFAALRLSISVKKVISLTGFSWDERLFAVAPAQELRPHIIETSEVPLSQALRPLSAWGGFLVFDYGRGQAGALRVSELLHRDSVVVELPVPGRPSGR